jgi:nanoRNase/pAp phosphatase (c-di-AMP/oligoRNAs hydrolase)
MIFREQYGEPFFNGGGHERAAGRIIFIPFDQVKIILLNLSKYVMMK